MRLDRPGRPLSHRITSAYAERLEALTGFRNQQDYWFHRWKMPMSRVRKLE